jgi:SAM-dependent methyltransferase
MLKQILRFIRPRRDKKSFILKLPDGAKIFDIGCGNNSPGYFKKLRPDLYYVGIDIADCNQSASSLSVADCYIKTTPEKFAYEILQQKKTAFDAIVSAHNLEHCLEPDDVVRSICEVLRPGGSLYLSFPAEASVRFPHRRQTLNFYDDPSHRSPPKWSQVCELLDNAGMEIIFKKQHYRPFMLFLIGLIYEPYAAITHGVSPYNATWALYGFESVIWASKKA